MIDIDYIMHTAMPTQSFQYSSLWLSILITIAITIHAARTKNLPYAIKFSIAPTYLLLAIYWIADFRPFTNFSMAAACLFATPYINNFLKNKGNGDIRYLRSFLICWTTYFFATICQYYYITSNNMHYTLSSILGGESNQQAFGLLIRLAFWGFGIPIFYYVHKIFIKEEK
jgi:hypothetical protein